MLLTPQNEAGLPNRNTRQGPTPVTKLEELSALLRSVLEVCASLSARVDELEERWKKG